MVAALGNWAIRKARDYGYAAGFLLQVLKETALFIRRKQVAFRVLVLQILFTGVESLSIVSLIALSIGAVIIVEGGTILPRFGQTSLMYSILIIVITRELGPILTAFIIIARSGTAIATELGNMVVSHEIEAYISVGINPISYLVVPRVLGVTISVMVLTVYFNIFGLVGSFLVSQLIHPVPALEYFRALLRTMQLRDILSTVVKSFVFGVIISVVATYQGFKVSASVTEIPRAAIKAVGQGFVLCFLADALITMIYYV
ncbi:MAG: ABC transporter permease [Spirochaetia bacterium]|jgi:phospholipid/cholesterol/gamma-HCH transport system permease protein